MTLDDIREIEYLQDRKLQYEQMFRDEQTISRRLLYLRLVKGYKKMIQKKLKDKEKNEKY